MPTRDHDEDEDALRRRAYSIWEREGRPEGRHSDHWDQARREATGQAGGQATGPEAAEGRRDPLNPEPRPGAPRRIKPGQTPGPNAGSRATRRGRE